MKKRIAFVILVLLSLFMLVACECDHVYTEPTCLSPSYCIKCGATKGVSLDHQYALENYVPSTCIESGYYLYKCNRCNIQFKVDLELEEHNYVNVNGQKVCEDCHVKVNQNTCEHEYSTATCTVSGACIKCGKIREAALNHLYVLVESKEPTKDSLGYWKFKCSRCEDTIIINKVITDGIKNLIIVIGDGMGYEHVSAAMFANKKTYTFTNWKSISVNTDCLNSLKQPIALTDSAAGGTAIATGTLTLSGYVAKDADKKDLETILDYAKAKNMATGVVTTDTIYGATPSAFTGHSVSRDSSTEIMKSQLTSGVDIIVGTTSSSTTSVINKYKTNQNFVTTWEDYNALTTIDNQIIGSFDIETDDDATSLYEVVNKTMALLENDNGFVLMVEQAHVDKHSHNNDFANMIKAVDSLGKTVDAILKKHGDDTAIIITADHETGGISASSTTNLAKKYNNMSYAWTSTSHTNSDICLYYYNFEYDFSSLSYFKRNDFIKNCETYNVCRDILDSIKLAN